MQLLIRHLLNQVNILKMILSDFVIQQYLIGCYIKINIIEGITRGNSILSLPICIKNFPIQLFQFRICMQRKHASLHLNRM